MKKKIISLALVLGICAVMCISNHTVEAARQNKKASAISQIEVTEEKTAENTVTKKEETSTKKTDTKAEKKKSTDKKSTDERSTEKKSTETKTTDTKEVKSDTTTAKTTDTKTAADGKVTQEDFAVEINGVVIALGVDMNEYVEALGDPDDYTQARSCLHDGDDKIYEYGGITLYTYPDQGKDIVYIAELTGEEKTLSGVGIGSTKEELIAAYGSAYVEDPTFLTYEYEEGKTISFQIQNKQVVYIEFYAE